MIPKVHVGKDLLQEVKEFCQKLGQRVVVITDPFLEHSYGKKLAETLSGELLVTLSGEKAKSQETVGEIITKLLERGLGRDTVLIALGGGVTTDLVGFIASIYMRGVDLILMPTTLLAMVDASIGGKTGINTPFGKNLVGTIYPPKAVFTDLNFLSTLPKNQWVNGLAEILKMGLIRNHSLWNLAQKSGKDLELIEMAVKEKIAVVEEDPNEQSLRRILNFGHTIAHGLEAVADYSIEHGEAVAIGSLVEAHLSKELGYLSESEFSEIEKGYRLFSLKLPKSYDRDKFLEALSHDKKKAKGKLRFVLIDRIGHAIEFEKNYCRAVSLDELEMSLNFMEITYG